MLDKETVWGGSGEEGAASRTLSQREGWEMSVSGGGGGEEEMRKMWEEETQRERKCAGLKVGSKDWVWCIVSLLFGSL